MKKIKGKYQLSATDLSQHLGCVYIAYLDKQLANGQIEKPDWSDPYLPHIQKIGLLHEQKYKEKLMDEGREVVTLQQEGQFVAKPEDTLHAMSKGVEIIAQAPLQLDRWQGVADFLIRVEGESALGDYHYEVLDTKLSQTTKAGTILQLSLYSNMIAKLQDRTPEFMYVARPDEMEFMVEHYRVADYAAFFRLMQDRLIKQIDQEDIDLYPHPVTQCSQCRWWTVCEKVRRADDHLQYVAGLQTNHRKELEQQDISCLTDFAHMEIHSLQRPGRGSRITFEKLHHQAMLQVASQKADQIPYEVLALEEEAFGLKLLPEPSPGDVFFDLESARFYQNKGLEFLFGIWYRQGEDWQYQDWWAYDFAEERDAFVQWLAWVEERMESFPDLHIYHFGHKEPSTLKQLMTRYGVGQELIDQLLRGERFVDLSKVFRRSFRAGIEGYGLKDLEPLINFQRQQDLEEVKPALRLLQQIIEMGDPATIPPESRAIVRAYNREDCIATQVLRDWLETERRNLILQASRISRPQLKTGEAKIDQQKDNDRIIALQKQLHHEVPALLEDCRNSDKPYWLLGHLVKYFDVEQKVKWWDYFRIREMETEDLFYERKAIIDLEFLETITPKKANQMPIIRYLFPDQEFSVDKNDEVLVLDGDIELEKGLGTIYAINIENRVLDIKQKGDYLSIRPRSIQLFLNIKPGAVKEALLSFADQVITARLQGSSLHVASWELLKRNKPRLKFRRIFHQVNGQNFIDQALDFAHHLDNSVLAIQGPPGTGKTYCGSHLIVHLHRMGYRIGVTAVSKKVIEGMLKAIHKSGQKLEYSPRLIMKRTRKDCPENIQPVSSPQKFIDQVLGDNDRPIGGDTAWRWSDPQLYQKLDYLVIDEAGQMSLAYVLAAGMSAKNIILLGDPQQLEQPQQGAHPEGVGVSALEHYIGVANTISPDRGLFMPQTWRLHPTICEFVSTLYYNNRLEAKMHTTKHRITGHPQIQSCGLYLVSVQHEGNRNKSLEEADAIDELVRSLITGSVQWSEFDPEKGRITTGSISEKDILIVAPFNGQVNLLKSRLPDMEIGTVDKFQGRQAPIVIYSTTCSSADDAPRGMEFLYDPHRLNVAVSRAKGVCIMVASPQLFEPECHSPRQMTLANGFCLYKEMAVEI